MVKPRPCPQQEVALHWSVRFWKVSVLSTDPVTAVPESPVSTSAPIQSVSLQARDGIAISSDSYGVVKTWDISTGLCKASFQTLAIDNSWRDVQLVDDKLILAWCKNDQIHIWDIGKSKLLQRLDTGWSDHIIITWNRGSKLRISGDGSRIYCLDNKVLLAWEMWTWKYVGKVKLEGGLYLDPFCPGGPKIWVQYPNRTQEWDFRTSDSPPSHYPRHSWRDLTWISFVVFQMQYLIHLGLRIQSQRKEFFNYLEDMYNLIRCNGMDNT